ncbi:MAG: SIMPL domain-containing protein [Alphaproteobacteria bacterium]|nr:SIMPL domain-containing protein [Alphaproteobacteria bacterium]
MKRQFVYMMVVCAGILLPPSVSSAEMVAMRKAAPMNQAQKNCALEGKASVRVQFKDSSVDIEKVQEYVDTKMKSAQAQAKEAGLTSVEIQSMNYSLRTQNNNYNDCSKENLDKPDFRVNGSVTFEVEPREKAAAFMALLTKQGYEANLNVNAYKRCR